MGRLNYNLAGKYLLAISARYDGSSRLAPVHKWALCLSAALAWRIKEQAFMKDIDAVSNLKLRVGYGITGNTAIDPYKTRGSLEYGRYTYGSQGVLSFCQKEIPNHYLSWESTTQWNAGLDFGFIGGKICGVIDLYSQNTEGAPDGTATAHGVGIPQSNDQHAKHKPEEFQLVDRLYILIQQRRNYRAIQRQERRRRQQMVHRIPRKSILRL
jgi:hypothetical protein